MEVDKIQNLKDMEYYASYILVSELVLKWSKAKPDNEEIKALSKAWADVHFYVNTKCQELRLHKQAISEYRYDKNQAILEKQEKEKEVKKLNKEIIKLKKIVKK